MGGHLTCLRRTRIGGYPIDMAIELDTLGAESAVMTMAEAARRSFPVVEVSAAQARDVGHGRSLDLSVPADPTAVIGPDGDLLALYRPAGAQARPVAVLV